MKETLFARTAEVLVVTGGMAILAEEMGVDLRTVERWYSGAMFPPAGVWRELLTRVRDLRQECAEVEQEIERQLVGF